MFEKLAVSLVGARHTTLRKLVDLSDHKGLEAANEYRSLDILDSKSVNVGGMIGIPAIYRLSKAKIPIGAVRKSLIELVYSAVLELASDLNHWNFQGTAENQAAARAWIGDGPEHIRTRRIQELLNIQERPRSRFMTIDDNQVAENFDDFGTKFESPGKSAFLLLDAHAFAKSVKACKPGWLFELKSKGDA